MSGTGGALGRGGAVAVVLAIAGLAASGCGSSGAPGRDGAPDDLANIEGGDTGGGDIPAVDDGAVEAADGRDAPAAVDAADGGGPPDAPVDAPDGGEVGGGGMVCGPSCGGSLCADFPADPIFDGAVPATVAGSFVGSVPVGAGGPCISEPQDGTLYPNNGLRPRVKFSNPAGKVAQIRMSAANQANVLVAYTQSDSWILPVGVWQSLRCHQVADIVTVTVWLEGGQASSVRFSTAPVPAPGNIVFWSANPALVGAQPQDCYANPSLCSNASELRGFAIGDDTTVSVLAISQVMQQSRRQDSGNPAPVICIGCHAETPDDSFVSVVDHYSWRAAVAGVSAPSVGARFTALTQGGLDALQQPGWGRFAFTRADGYWQPGLRIGVASLGEVNPLVADWSNSADANDSPHLAWINLEAPVAHVHQASEPANWAYPSYAPGAGINSGNALGFMARTGDPYGAATPTWSHDGTTVAYASTNAAISGRLNMETPNPTSSTDPTRNASIQFANAARVPGLTNIYTVPFNLGMGGAATPVSGAATTQFEEYYPAYSPDDKLLAFSRVPAGDVMYANPRSEIAVVRATGDNNPITRLAANDPPACTGKVSPGVDNHWPKWSPQAQASDGQLFYWLIFASNRTDTPPVRAADGHFVSLSQLYIAAIVVTDLGVQTYPAIYLWNQPVDRVNTTPAWATFAIPSPP